MSRRIPTDVVTGDDPISDVALAASLPSTVANLEKTHSSSLTSTAPVADTEALKPMPKQMPTPKRTPKPRQASSSKLGSAKATKGDEGDSKQVTSSTNETVAESGADDSGTVV